MALSTIGTNSVADSAVTSAKISDGTIATGDIANDAITGAKVADLDALTVSGDLTVQGTTTAQGTTVGFVSFDKLLLNATDGSATDAGDNLILNGTDATSANADSSILFDDGTGDPAITSTSFGVKKVLQVVHAGNFPEQSFTLHTTPLATAVAATITPLESTSKILINYTFVVASNTSGASVNGCKHIPYFDIGQTGTFTPLHPSKYFGGRSGGSAGNYGMLSTAGMIEHDHNTTSPIDYVIYVVNSSSFDVQIGRGGTNSNINSYDGYNSITLMEIAG